MEQQLDTVTYGELAPQFVIELVADDAPGGGFQLLLWNGTEQHIQSSLRQEAAPGSEVGARMFRVPQLDSTMRRAIRFPTRAAAYDSVRQLFDDVRALIEKYTGLCGKWASLAAYSVLASWVVDCIETPICLSIVGPESTQGRQLFRLLACLYRRALLLSELSLAGVYGLPMDLCPALFIDQFEPNEELHRLLRASGTRDTYVPRNGRLMNLCCAKVISSEVPLYEAAAGGSFIEIPVTTLHEPLPTLDQRTQQQIADDFQPKLLMFRLKTYKRVGDSDFDVPQFAPPIRELARTLGACVSQEPELIAEIVPLLAEQSERALSERPIDLHAVVVEAMLLLCHEGKKESVHVKTIAARVNKILEQRGEMFEMGPKPVGNRMRALGFPTQRLDAAGRGLLLCDAVRRHIHKLASDHQIPILRGGLPLCRHCMPLDNMRSNEVNLNTLSQKELDEII